MFNMKLLLSSILFAILTFVTRVHSYSFSQGRCIAPSLTINKRLVNPCQFAVQYPFYLPPGKTPYDLINSVNARLNASFILSYPVACQQAMLKHYCSTTFLKCQPGVTLTNNATYNYQIYQNDTGNHLGVPFQRPCATVCTNLLTQCTGGLFTKFDKTPNCYEKYDYSFGIYSTATLPYRFDFNGTYKCFTATSNPLPGPYESYNRSAHVCKGFVNNLYMPPGNKLNSTFTVLQPPSVIQSIINSKLAPSMNKLPKWIDKECAIAIRKYLCYSNYLSPLPVSFARAVNYSGYFSSVPVKTALASVMNSNVYVPSYPSHDLCKHYESVCAKFLVRANNPLLIPNCSSVTVNNGITVHLYPNVTQTIAAAKVGNIVIKFPSDPYVNTYYNETEFTYTTSCPHGFVVPEHPDEHGVQWVSGTGCAVACRAPLWTDDEWDNFDTVTGKLPVISLILGLILIIFIAATQEVYHSYLVFIFAVLSTFNSIVNAIFVRDDMDARFCYDNAIPKLQSQGHSSCVVQAGVTIYTFLACCAITFMIVLDSHLRKMHHFHVVESIWYQILVFFNIFILPLIPTCYASNNEYLGFYRTQPWCFFVQTPFAPENLDIAWTAMPVIVCVIATYVTFFITYLLERKILMKEVKIAVAEHDLVEEDPRNRNMCSPKTIVKNPFASRQVVWFSLIVFIPFMVSKATQYFEREDVFSSFQDWTKCVFINYDGTDSFYEDCGTHSSNRPRTVLNILTALSLTGNMIIITPVYIIFYFVGRWIYRDIPAELEEGRPEEHLHMDEKRDIEMVPTAPQAVAVVHDTVQNF